VAAGRTSNPMPPDMSHAQTAAILQEMLKLVPAEVERLLKSVKAPAAAVAPTEQSQGASASSKAKKRRRKGKVTLETGADAIVQAKQAAGPPLSVTVSKVEKPGVVAKARAADAKGQDMQGRANSQVRSVTQESSPPGCSKPELCGAQASAPTEQDFQSNRQ